MNAAQRIAADFREMYTDGNWTCTNLRDMVKDVPWQQAMIKPHGLNSLLALVYHIHYYVRVVTRVLQGGPLSGSDKESYNHPPISSQEEWEQFLGTVWMEGEEFARLVEQLPEERLWENFANEKYGNYYRNLNNIIKHTHYHLGQIPIIKKLTGGTTN